MRSAEATPLPTSPIGMTIRNQEEREVTMRLRTRLERLERRLQPSHHCPACGWPPDRDRTTILLTCPQEGLTRDPPDPRPICPACKLPEGGITLLWAEPEDGYDALRSGAGWDDDP